MTEIITTAIASIIGTVLAAVVPLLIQNRTLKRTLREAPTVARGLAVGYFYNFLSEVDSRLKQGTLIIRFPSDEHRVAISPDSTERVCKFSSNQIEIILIVPKRLTAAAFTHSREKAKLPEAEILRPGDEGGRGFKINYQLSERDGQFTLLITDLVRPYFAIKRYAEDYLNMDQDSEPWRQLEQDTLPEFRNTVERLRNIGDGVGINQILWREIE